MKIIPAIFEEREIRRFYDEKSTTKRPGLGFFSVADIVQILTQQSNYQTARKYWNKLKERLGKEGSQSVTNCRRLKIVRRRQQKLSDRRRQCRNSKRIFGLTLGVGVFMVAPMKPGLWKGRSVGDNVSEREPI